MNELNGHPERIVPDATSSGIVAIHLKRYDFARDYVIGKRVLDLACGVGYGTRYLADVALFVIGVDVDTEATRYAIQRYGGADNVSILQTDAALLPFTANSFQAICSFETIEHLPDVKRYLREVTRSLGTKWCVSRFNSRCAAHHSLSEKSSSSAGMGTQRFHKAPKWSFFIRAGL